VLFLFSLVIENMFCFVARMVGESRVVKKKLKKIRQKI
jgi:hypothetical protein